MAENPTTQMERPQNINLHTKIAFYGPVVIIFAPVTLAALITFFVFMFTHWTSYVALTGNIIGWVLSLFCIAAIIGLCWLASKALRSLFDAFIALGHGIVGVGRAASEAKGQAARNRIVDRGDTWVAIADKHGDVTVVPVIAEQHRYNYKVTELPPAPAVPALPAPVPTGRELLLNGSVARALAEGLIILGVNEAGGVETQKIRKCFSTIVSGLPSSGKTTTVFWIVSQLTLIGAKLWVIDPHMYFESEEGEKSLAAELSQLSDSFMFEPCDAEPEAVIGRVAWMYAELQRRQKPGYIVRAENTVIGIMDEFNSIAAAIDPKKTIVTHQGHALNFAGTVALLEREGRKYGLHFMLIGHKWTQKDIGGDNAVRTNATTYLCHRLNDTGQADLLLGSGQGKKVLLLQPGHYWITGITWSGEPSKIITPFISAADIPSLLAVKAQRITVVKPENVVEGTIEDYIGTSDVASVSRPSGVHNGYSGRPFSAGGRDTGRDTGQPGTPLDATTGDMALSSDLRTKMLMVLQMDSQNANQNDIIKAVWGVGPDTREGRAAKEDLKAIRSFMATSMMKSLGV